MKASHVRAVLALLIVGVFMLITALMAIFPLVSTQKVVLSEYADFFNKTSSVYTGIVGVIIGYYFGRSSDSKVPESAIASQDSIDKSKD
jgi:mannose/fructose/N-acetylgalactosamine-specific phosphotransferase system component IID